MVVACRSGFENDTESDTGCLWRGATNVMAHRTSPCLFVVVVVAAAHVMQKTRECG